MANNPRWAQVRSQANQDRASSAGRQQAVLAGQALAVLQNQAPAAGHVARWIQALQCRIDQPDAALAELAEAMTPPMTKHAYAALLRRALRGAGLSVDEAPAEHSREGDGSC